MNSDRDEMNRLKLAQFARDTNQELIHFDSRDKFGGEIEDEAPKKIKKSLLNQVVRQI